MEFEITVDIPTLPDSDGYTQLHPTSPRANREERRVRHVEQRALLIPEEELF